MATNSHEVWSAAWSWAGESLCALKRHDKEHMNAHRDVLLFVVRHWGAVNPQHAPDHAAHLLLMSYDSGITVIQRIRHIEKLKLTLCISHFFTFPLFPFFHQPTIPAAILFFFSFPSLMMELHQNYISLNWFSLKWQTTITLILKSFQQKKKRKEIFGDKKQNKTKQKNYPVPSSSPRALRWLMVCLNVHWKHII